MKNLCKDCLNFFQIFLPEDSFSVYDWNLCDGCFMTTMTTNPGFYLKLCKLPKKDYVSIVFYERTNVN